MERQVVYLIDDDEDDRDIFTMALKDTDAHAKCFSSCNGIEALEALNNSEIPDYIFIDLNMPRMSGRECLEEIRKRPMLQNVPAVIYTTSSLQKDADELKELGATHYLVKPNSLNKLTTALKNILSGEPLPYFINVSA